MLPEQKRRKAGLTPINSNTQRLPLGAAMLAGLSLFSASSLAKTGGNAEEAMLSTVRVEADAEKPDGALATKTRVGKQVQDPQDIPQAVTTITNTLMQQQQVSSLRDALRNVSGLTFNAAEGGRSGDNMNLRGFYTFGDMYLDGIRDTAQYNRETFNLEQIDVLRGAGAMLFGRGQAGGVINQVSKTPLPFDQYKVSGSVGTQGYGEGTLDLNKTFSDNVALRVNALQREEGSWRHNPASGTEPEIHRRGLAASLGLNLQTDNQFWINYYRLQTHDNPDYGISFDPETRRPGTRLPTDYYWGIDRSFDNSDTEMTTVVNEYQFSADSQLRTQLRFADYERSYWAKTPNLINPPDALGSIGGNKTRAARYKTATAQSDYSTKFTGLGMAHEALVGAEYLREDSHRRALQNFGTPDAPDYRPYKESESSALATFSSHSYAVYLQDTVEFVPHWKATLGVRRDQMKANYSSMTSPTLKYGENSYRSAISYQPTDDTHYYLSWSNSFSPTADLYQLSRSALPAERSDVIELGSKWLLLNGDLALRAAVYQATKKWERSNDFESTAAVLTKKRRTTGLELEAAGRITDRWEIFSGASLMNAKILDVADNIDTNTGELIPANPEYKGKRARNTPPYTLNVWTTYQLTSRWTVGGGVETKGERLAFNPSRASPAPTLNGVYQPNAVSAYARWDAMVSYEQAKWAVRLNVKNVFNQRYYDSVYDNGAFAVPGTKRAFILTTEFTF